MSELAEKLSAIATKLEQAASAMVVVNAQVTQALGDIKIELEKIKEDAPPQ